MPKITNTLVYALSAAFMSAWPVLARASGGVRSAIVTPAAEFPKELNAQCISGRVDFLILVGPDGAVSNYRELHSTNTVLSRVVASTVREGWRFVPQDESSLVTSNMSFQSGCSDDDGAGFDPSSLLTVVTGMPARDFWTSPANETGSRRDGFSVLVPDSSALAMLESLRSRMTEGYVTFIAPSKPESSEPATAGMVQLVIAPGSNQFDILRLVGTAAPNHGLTNADIISRLEKWNPRYGVNVLGAGEDYVSLLLRAKPSNPDAFADELYAFCPDIVDQGFGDLDSLKAALRTSREVFLWWD